MKELVRAFAFAFSRVSPFSLYLVQDIDDLLPPFRPVFHPHGKLEHSTDLRELRQNTLAQEIVRYSVFFPFQANAVIDIYVDKSEVVPIEDYEWIAGCAPSLPAWNDPIDFTFWPPPPSTAPKASSLTTKR
ncbi:uncharacterized protein ARMOST_02640 [Armillaria ostoyae]|uniref:Uncharacterized protein n=1 Tax=Armillaria ostoyae TaxID=47428 RepID=A0A284QSC1_ARMOS|nr:uncharacterized protein ARMOST_02640 [Armillaria ostoyae]